MKELLLPWSKALVVCFLREYWSRKLDVRDREMWGEVLKGVSELT